jgi:hypothetical protein
MFVITVKQKHAIYIRVSHCDYAPRATKSVATPHVTVSHRVKQPPLLRNPEVHYLDHNSTPWNNPSPPPPSPPKNTQNV